MTENVAPLPPVPGLEGAALASYWYGLADQAEIAKVLDVSERTLEGYRLTGGGPPFVRVSARCVKYQRIGAYLYMKEREHSSTAEYATA